MSAVRDRLEAIGLGQYADAFDSNDRRFPEFAEALARGRERSYAEIAANLFERAMGWSHPAVKISRHAKKAANP